MRMMRTRFTRTDYDALPEGFPAQLVDGMLVKEPASTYGHGRVSTRIQAALLRFVAPDLVPAPPSDVLIDDWNVFQPDVVVLREPVEDDAHYVGVPLIAMEIHSPSTPERDRSVKAERLLEIGVDEVWLIEPATKTIEVRTLAGRMIARGADAATSTSIEGFRLVPDELFSSARR